MTEDFLHRILERAESSGLDCHIVLVEQKALSLRIACSKIEQPSYNESFFAFVKLGRSDRVASGQAEASPLIAVDKAWQEAKKLLEESPTGGELHLAPPVLKIEQSQLPPLPEPRELIEFAGAALEGRENAAGMLKAGERLLAVINSQGLLATAKRQLAHFFLSQNSFFESAAPTLGELTLPESIYSSKAEPGTIAPGGWRVLLGPSAVSDLVEGIAECGFGSKGYLEGSSFFHRTKTVGDELFTLTDDWKLTGGLPFDFEGTHRSILPLVEKGEARGLATNLATAKKLGTTSTGHSLPPWEDEGPLPLNLTLQEGEEEDLLASLGDGLFIPRFHYLGLVDPKTATFTGTIRNSLWVEGGKPKKPLLPLRFTESFLDLASRVETVGKQRQLVPGTWGSNLVPGLVLSCFTFA